MESGERQNVYVLEKRTAEGTGVIMNLLCCICATRTGAKNMADYMVRQDGVKLTWTRDPNARTRWVAVVSPEVSYIITKQQVFD